jgi:diacylglycerol kinase family enzyme
MVEKGVPWEQPATGPAEWHVDGDDATLAAAVRDHPGARVEFRPDAGSDLARALGVHEPGAGTWELGIDALRVTADGRELFGINVLVVGVAPDRATWLTAAPGIRVRVADRVVHDAPATAVVVASGQYLRGADLVPRGHPGDGRAEIQVYAVPRGQRAGVRSRLPQGIHLPHPDITQTSGQRVEIRADRGPLPVELDGVSAPPAQLVTVEVVPRAFVLVI